MDLSYRWLRKYVDVDIAPDDLAERLTMLGLEVDAVTSVGSRLDGVVVGEVLDVRDHPNADRLVLCDVDVGASEPVQIVCGAPNVDAGQKAPVATVGATLMLPDREDPDTRVPVEITARTMRGKDSHGMICAEDELGLSDDHAGIMVLDADASVGQPFVDYLAARDVEPDDAVIDIDLTPNRPDAASHFGVARDVAAVTGADLRRPDVNLPKEGGPTADAVTVDIQNPVACPRYVALRVTGVTVAESPLWLKRRLTAIGLRPRNNVVDVTNYVMHEIGQPLHAFDFEQIAGQTIVVRSTESEETVTTLDDAERTVPPQSLLIYDAERPVAVAGVMGGANSEVTDATTEVLIESAYFDPSTIRRTAKALGLQTDSSYRFERGVDRDGQVWAAARAAQLIAELGDGEVVPGMVDAHPTPPPARVVSLRPERMQSVLGAEIPTDEAHRLLDAVGFDVQRGDDALVCTVPTWRPDVDIEEDLIEEVARLHGYDRIPEPDAIPIPNTTPVQRANEALREQAREVLRGRGFREVYTNSMLRVDQAERFNTARPNEESAPVVRTKNPISQEMAALRPRLLPGLLDVMQFNRNHGQSALRFFEFGHVFRQSAEGEDPIVSGYREREALGVVLSGPHAPGGWDTTPRDADVFDLKGVAEMLLEDLRLDDATLTPRDAAGTNGQMPVTVQILDVLRDGDVLGSVARVHDDVADAFDLEDRPVFVAEFDWDAVCRHAVTRMRQSVEPVSRFPVVERDLAVLVGVEQPVGPMLETIRNAAGSLLNEAGVFDLYDGEGIPDGSKSVAFTLRFGADRTLTDDEVDERIDAIVDALQSTYGAALRSE